MPPPKWPPGIAVSNRAGYPAYSPVWLGGHSHHISVPNMLNIRSEAAFVMGLKDSTTNADLMYSRET